MGWLQKILTPPAPQKTGSLPVVRKNAGLPAQPLPPGAPQPQNLPNATIIYGVGASLLFVAAFSLLIAQRWFSALIVLAVGACLMGFALHLFKHQD